MPSKDNRPRRRRARHSDDPILYPSLIDEGRAERRHPWWERLHESLASFLAPTYMDEERRRVQTEGVRRYQRNLAGRSQDALIERVRRGWWLGPAPHGYQLRRHLVADAHGGRDERNRLIVDMDRAPTVPVIFTWRIGEEMGRRAIAARLAANSDQYPQPIDHSTGQPRPWTPAIVHTILSNPAYLGYVVWGRVRYGLPRNPDFWICSAEPSHVALVTPELYWAAQRKHEGDAEVNAQTSEDERRTA